MGPTEPETPRGREEGRVAEALRAAIESTLAATAPGAGQTRERAGELVDELSKRGQEAREEIARRGQEAGAELVRRGQEAREQLARRGQEAGSELRGQLDALERRLASIEDLLRRPGPEDPPPGHDTKPKAED